MTYHSDYKHLLSALQALSKNKLQKPRIPVAVAAAEGEALYKWALSDKEILVANGLDWTLVESLPQRVGALRQAEANWLREKISYKNSRDTWNAKSSEGLRLRDYLQMAVKKVRKCGRYCFHKNPKRLDGYASQFRRLEWKAKALEKSKMPQNVIPLVKATPLQLKSETGTGT